MLPSSIFRLGRDGKPIIDDVVNGLAFGSLLFVLASGFTLALGLIKVVNIAHGAFYMLGGYVTYTVVTQFGNFFLAIFMSGAVVCGLAMGLQKFVLHRFLAAPLRQVLFTFGVALIIAEVCRHIWGSYPILIDTPEWLQGAIEVGSVTLPKYRAFVIVVAAIIGVLLWFLITRTKLGAVVRACIDDQEIARAMGIDVSRIFIIMFGISGFLAGVAGAIGMPFIGAYQGVQFEVLTLTLLVVVIGGLGSVPGALLGSLLIGVIYTIGAGAFPEFSYFLLFGPMILVLIFRPTGLLGRRE